MNTGDTVVDNNDGSVGEGNFDKGGDANDDDMISVAAGGTGGDGG